jgi:hypothetical protein
VSILVACANKKIYMVFKKCENNIKTNLVERCNMSYSQISCKKIVGPLDIKKRFNKKKNPKVHCIVLKANSYMGIIVLGARNLMRVPSMNLL